MSFINTLRKWRRAWLPLVAIFGFTVIYAVASNGIVILNNCHYPASLPVPHHSGTPAHRIDFLLDAERNTILPGVLYYYRIYPLNTMLISLDLPDDVQNLVSATINELEIIFSDGLSETIATGEQPLIRKISENQTDFRIKTATLNKSDIKIQCSGFFESANGEKVFFRIFKNMKYRQEFKFQTRRPLKNIFRKSR
jgi:hypothetical protein